MADDTSAVELPPPVETDTWVLNHNSAGNVFIFRRAIFGSRSSACTDRPVAKNRASRWGVLGEGHGELEFNRVEDSDVASAEPPVKVRKVHHADSASKYTTPMKVTVL